MTNDESKAEGRSATGMVCGRFDLEERTARFGEAIIRFAKRVPLNPVTGGLIRQLVNAGTSVGANYGEANDADSKKDFRHKIGICRKESKETKHWLRMMVVAAPDLCGDARVLWQEAKELNLILGKIIRSSSSPQGSREITKFE